MLSTIISLFGNSLISLLTKLLGFGTKLIEYLYVCKKDKMKKEKQKSEDNFNKKVDDICNNGSIDDLIDLKKKI